MGIRYLTTTVKPYAEPCVLGDGSRIVIDGPSLAYHIIGLCSSRHGQTTPFSQPSYQLLADTALAWLQELERHGPTIAAIYFDAHLPIRKLPERLERVSKISRQLNTFFLSTPLGVSEAPPRSDTVKLFPTLAPVSSSTANLTLPVPPLAVQAICDALRASVRYGEHVFLVPEEADCYCAHSVRVSGGTVLTSDSDLLVFDLGKYGNVTLFQDITAPVGAATQGLSAMRYSPTAISKRLGILAPYGMSSLAFELMMDPHVGPGKLLEKARQGSSIRSSPEEYRRFMEEYRLHPVSQTSGPTETITSAEMVGMDSRLAELIVQYLAWCKSCGKSSATRHDEPALRIFLPPLVDSWSRTSSWDMSTSVRCLAYRILRLLGPTSTAAAGQIREYRRMITADSAGTLLPLPPMSGLDASCATLAALVRKIRAKINPHHPALVWVVFAIDQELQWSRDAGKESLGMQILTASTDSEGNIRDPASWDVLHFVAQVQGALYSLRLLKQMLDFVARRMTLSAPHADLLSVLELPSITHYCSVNDVKDLPRRLKDSGGLEALQVLAGLSEPIVFGPGSDRRKKKKRKRDAGNSAAKPTAKMANTSKNPFSLLDSVAQE